MIRCEECTEWYHDKCVKVTPEEADTMGDAICSGCHRHTPGGSIHSDKSYAPPYFFFDIFVFINTVKTIK